MTDTQRHIPSRFIILKKDVQQSPSSPVRWVYVDVIRDSEKRVQVNQFVELENCGEPIQRALECIPDFYTP